MLATLTIHLRILAYTLAQSLKEKRD